MHDRANCRRDSAVSAAFEKNFDQVKPPSEISTLSCGCFCCSLRSWLKLPRSAWVSESATPSTLSSAEYARWESAKASPTPASFLMKHLPSSDTLPKA